VAAAGKQPERPRTLVLRPDGRDRLAYALLRADGPRLGDAEMRLVGRGNGRLDDVVSQLASGTGVEAADDLVPYGVRFVLLSRTADSLASRELLRALDAVPGLVPVSRSARARAWKVDLPVGRVRVLPAATPSGTPSGVGQVLPTGAVDVRTEVPASAAARWVVLADTSHEGWYAALDGKPLRARTYDGWAQAFVLPTSGGTLEIGFDQGYRTALLWVQLVGFVVCLVLTFPAARSRDDVDDVAASAASGPHGRRARQPAQARS